MIICNHFVFDIQCHLFGIKFNFVYHDIDETIFTLQSVHPAAEYHGAARAVGGCAIYVRYALNKFILFFTSGK